MRDTLYVSTDDRGVPIKFEKILFAKEELVAVSRFLPMRFVPTNSFTRRADNFDEKSRRCHALLSQVGFVEANARFQRRILMHVKMHSKGIAIYHIESSTKNFEINSFI